ncbi:MAG: HAMP domain-containing histidine kinase [Chitinophagales bacterium]|nr:HAMP domain-containing histidine kinase [Chitinophagales bacterium]MDW8427737.1 HAMP domain-containing sensor histidine kinase [Chitinophagales bacterium]
MNFARFRRYDGLWLGAGALLLAFAYLLSWQNSPQQEIRRAARSLVWGVEKLLQEIERRYDDDRRIAYANDVQLKLDLIEQYARLPYSLLVFQHDSLVFWTTSQNIPIHSTAADQVEVHKLRNGWFLTVDKPADSTGRWLRYALPLRYEYDESNRYLNDHWNACFKIPSYIGLKRQDSEQSGGHTVSLFGQTLALYLDATHEGNRPGYWGLGLFIAALLFFTAGITFRLEALLAANRLIGALVLVTTYVAAVAIYVNSRWLPADVQYWRLFQPELFASPGLAASLGAFFIVLLLLVWAAAVLNYHIRFRIRIRQRLLLWLGVQLGVLVGVILLVAGATYLIKTLVEDSHVQFAFFNPLDPDWNSIAGVLCIAMILIALHLIASKMLLLIHWDEGISTEKLLVLLGAALLSVPLVQWVQTGFPEIYLVLWSVAYLLASPWFLLSLRKRLEFSKLNLIAIGLVASGAILLYRYGEEKEKDVRLTYARMLVRERDPVIEYLLTDMRSRIEQDDFLSQSFSYPVLNAGIITQRLMRRYLSQGFGRYDVSIYAYHQNGDLLFYEPQPGRLITERGLLAEVEATSDPDLFYAPGASGGAHYIARYRITTSDSVVNRLYVVLRNRALQLTRLYPVLLLPDKDRLPDVNPQYSFAVYRNGKLQAAHGEYAYEYDLWRPVEQHLETIYVTRRGYNHLILSSGEKQVVVVTRKVKPIGYFLSYFSFLFLTVFFLSTLVMAFRLWVMEARGDGISRLLNYAPLRTTIQLTFVIFLAPLLMVLSYVTGRFALAEFNQLVEATVLEKLERIGSAAKQTLERSEEGLTPAEQVQLLREQLDMYEKIHSSDLNLYDATGRLVATTQPAIFKRGIQAPLVNPIAYQLITGESKANVVLEEQTGRLKNFSGYYALRTQQGALLAFINLPYYNSGQSISEEVGFFFVMLVNILVVALVVSGLVAPLLSRQIMQRLQVIQGKLQKVKLGAANEPIDWPAHDEIGDLVREYNKMIKELERSAEQLARTAREAAWREMAKQVAHEIKNPLTPMKLSVQHLLRAVINQDPQAKELTTKVCKTLIEQIDTLSAIASEFSDFAKMPDPVFEEVDVHEVLSSAVALHKEQETASLQMFAHASNSIVVADRQQLLRVFSNLILNAIQAIPPQRKGRIDLITQNQDNSVIISITDNGIGIEPEDANRVFVPNFTTKSSGAGLGLAISKGIVESFGGTISFQSQPGIGTTFFVQLPSKQAKSVSTQQRQTVQSSQDL